MNFAIFVASTFALSSASQETLQAHDLFSIAECPALVEMQPAPAHEMRWPPHIERSVPNPFLVRIRCEVVAEGNLAGCVARTDQQHSLGDLRFIELYVMRSKVADAPRSCGEVTVTFQIPQTDI
ncbi:hypothetical protein [Aurantiacibacter sp. MUD61]|uniref:hypothetical protein n=1 Tax=Aurantiacibacter sp. MUD61 TaxID=3009083 RepID=UPI0022F09F65|nr:hypothetical protein [Aurantiacibacter sp. MUD61]